MEVVTIMVGRAVEQGLLSPIGRCTAVQRLSIFVDDVVIFLKLSVGDLVTVRELLRLFGHASGLTITTGRPRRLLLEEGSVMVI
jgi:hypothetical protein